MNIVVLVVVVALIVACICRRRDSMKVHYCNLRGERDGFKDKLLKWQEEMGWERGTEDDHDVVYPCGLTATPGRGDVIMRVEGHDELTLKERLWENMAGVLGRMRAETIMPTCWTSLDAFARDHDPRQIYILKKNVQRKKGLKLCRTYDDVRAHFNRGYVVIQKYMDPYLIDDRKINLRVYVLLIKKPREGVELYVHEDVVVIPTSQRYDPLSEEESVHYTSLGVSNQCDIYDAFPHDMKRLERITGRIDLDAPLRAVKTVCDARMPQYATFDADTTFQLLGADFLVATDGRPYLLEFNTGPQMNVKCAAYHQDVKTRVVRDVFRAVGVAGDGARRHGFRHIVS